MGRALVGSSVLQAALFFLKKKDLHLLGLLTQSWKRIARLKPCRHVSYKWMKETIRTTEDSSNEEQKGYTVRGVSKKEDDHGIKFYNKSNKTLYEMRKQYKKVVHSARVKSGWTR